MNDFGGLLVRLTTENLLTKNLVSHIHHFYSPTKALIYKPVSPGIFITFSGGRRELPREISTELQYIIITKYNMNKSEVTLVKVRMVFSASSSSISFSYYEDLP